MTTNAVKKKPAAVAAVDKKIKKKVSQVAKVKPRADKTPREKTWELTDLANAEKMISLRGEDILYSPGWGRWMTWDGKRWIWDQGGHRVMHMAAETSRTIVGEEKENFDRNIRVANDDETKILKARLANAISSQSAPRLRSMVQIASSNPEVAIAHEEFDSDIWELNVQNGTVDLRTGQLHEHRREGLHTKMAPVEFDPQARAPTWVAFLEQVTAGSAGLKRYLARSVGYGLTGCTREHVIFYHFGNGGRGKSTFLQILTELLGDYAWVAPRKILFASKNERHPTELASLQGARFVVCSEVEKDQMFDEALVKDLTSETSITARRMGENFWSFVPTHKFMIAGNHKARVKGTDEGIWRRLKMIPWDVVPRKKDTQLIDKLREELPGILAWAVRACLEWQAGGLDEPAEVTDATKNYRDESDKLGEFFRLRCVFEDDARITRAALRSAYEYYCDENGDTPLGARNFTGRLREISGVFEKSVRPPPPKNKPNAVVTPRDGWQGIRLLTAKERGDMMEAQEKAEKAVRRAHLSVAK